MVGSPSVGLKERKERRKVFEGDVRVLASLRKECSVPEAVDAGRIVQVARLKEVRPDLLDHLRETEAYFCSASVTDLHY